ncbi:hypothetical protein [Streptomyces sp. HC307]|uniref:hypothetical protein n=1 Tax=Streptomyces flavusporus TaxID=3385496 RepID=UPI00391716D0
MSLNSVRIRRAGVTTLLAALAVGAAAGTASAATWSTSYRYLASAVPGDETSNWYAVGTNTQYITQTQCQSRYSGRISYDFMKSVTGFDEWTAWRDWSCDNVAYTKSYTGKGNGYYYADVNSTPGPGGVVDELTLQVYRVTS